LETSTIQNNGSDGIRLLFGSGLSVQGGTSVVAGRAGWGLQCSNGESSVLNTSLLALSGNTAGNISGGCTGF
jgi:hypothetical protein